MALMLGRYRIKEAVCCATVCPCGGPGLDLASPLTGCMSLRKLLDFLWLYFLSCKLEMIMEAISLLVVGRIK